jgi:hypothetical protein
MQHFWSILVRSNAIFTSQPNHSIPVTMKLDFTLLLVFQQYEVVVYWPICPQEAEG